MKSSKSVPMWLRTSMVILLVYVARPISAADFQLVSAAGSSSSASGNGNSGNPIVSADGRYVLFSSSANNLVLTNTAGPVPGTQARWQNVFLRDRVNGSNILISANLAGDGGNHNSWPCGISTNGQFVLFESSASDLVSNDNNNADDVFVRDVVHGSTSLISVNTNGVSGNGNSHGSTMTPDGNYVAFVSAANDLVPNDTNGIPDVFVRNQNNTTTRMTPGAVSTGSSTLPSTSESPAMTPDGRYITFYSTATNIVAGNRLVGGIYVCDRLANATVCVSSNAGSLFRSTYNTSNTVCCSPAISDDGRWVSFLVCTATNFSKGMILRYDAAVGQLTVVHTNAFVPTYIPFADIKTLNQSPGGQFLAFIANNPAAAGTTIIYLQNAAIPTNILVSADQTTGLAVAGFCDAPVVDVSGRYVTFSCDRTNNLTSTLLTGTGSHLYVRDMQLGSAQLIDMDTNGLGAGFGANFSVSADANLVAFEATTNSFVTNDGNGDLDVIARDLTQGTTELVSARHPWLPSLAPNRYSKLSPACTSTNARFVAFASDADNLVANDFNARSDIFVRDILSGTNILASVGIDGNAANDISVEPSISGDGNFVAYSSFATNLVAGDNNKAQDVFVYNLTGGTNLLVSATPAGGFGNSNSYSPRISSDGNFVLFRSRAQNLTADTFAAGTENLFLRNLALQTNYALTTGGVGNAAMTTDGHYVAYIGATGGNNFFVWDSVAATLIYTNASSALTNIAISPDGHWVAYSSGTNLYAYDLIGNSNYSIAAVTTDVHAGLQFSADDRLLTFVTKSKVANNDTNGTYDVYLHDFQNDTNILISQSFNTTNGANFASDSPSLSPDGRFVAYRSWASNIVPNDINNATDLYVYDRMTGTTLLITAGQNGNSSANNFSLTPIFSGDSQNLVFASYAANFSNPSFNEYNAIYVLNLFATGTNDSGGTQTNGFAANLVVTGNGNSGQSSGQPPVITWPCVTGKFYQVQFKNDLNDPVWQNLIGNTTQSGAQGQAVDLGAAGQSQRFYRIVLSN